MTIAIRPATSEDAPEIAKLHVESFLASYQRYPATHRSAKKGLDSWTEEWRRLLDVRDTAQSTVVAVVDGSVRGFARIGSSLENDRTGHIFSIHVAPDATGEGIGTQLMEKAVGSLRHAGFGAATLWVVADNSAACRFYETLGWSHEGVKRREILAFGTEDGDVVDVVRYRLDLEGEE